jgi:hypothetical protein
LEGRDFILEVELLAVRDSIQEVELEGKAYTQVEVAVSVVKDFIQAVLGVRDSIQGAQLAAKDSTLGVDPLEVKDITLEGMVKKGPGMTQSGHLGMMLLDHHNLEGVGLDLPMTDPAVLPGTTH